MATSTEDSGLEFAVGRSSWLEQLAGHEALCPEHDCITAMRNIASCASCSAVPWLGCLWHVLSSDAGLPRLGYARLQTRLQNILTDLSCSDSEDGEQPEG